ncbi:EscU/YscU/HrcU family type III secretion system export apparatus switch protein [Paeniglutamicibacter cryotolerans]|uniref:Flagellar biosynthetic protein FlhB n=1 Tax=Paeniglutamicibacter cryotolerans TaxID=670079 RepID=A0A839QCM9_9MICC|nr:EscU/YscU/HrcU family type III secretion system export apparatus switch protein [Paeniglutamicibacter cryotolerans]MBB2993879.1 flagellar biosynthetic protein FlhB [Paeniglutamicibacter cryotolerans]
MSEDSGERSEKATDQRMKDVRSKGKTSRSQDLAAWLGIGAAALMIPGLISLATQAMRVQVQTFEAVIAHPEPAVALAALDAGFASMPGILAPMLIVALVTVIAVSTAQGGIRFKKFKIDPKNLDLIAGTKRVFGPQALWQGLKALLKLTVIALVLWTVISTLMPLLLLSGSLPLSSLLASGSAGATSLIRASVMAGMVLAAIDVFVVMRRNRKHTRMTRKEVTDEHKRSDGDPLIKSQRRSRQMAMSRNRMMAGIADADVVIVNPVHFAVALKYEPGVSAPRVVAKGAGHVAGRIREEAGRTRVPLVKDIALARMLHADCGIGSEIPVGAYDQVARVLAFVMALKVRGAADAIHTLPGASPVPDPVHTTGGTE